MRYILLIAILAVLIGGCTVPWSECSKDSDCPQALCPGVIAKCDFGKCVNIYSNGTLANCTNVSIPNPAAKYCIDKGYQYKIETGPEGGQIGYCYVPLIPPSGDIPGYTHKCDEWAFYRGECPICMDYCELRPHIACVGYWNTSGSFPNCTCQYICSTATVCSSDSDCPSGYTCYNSRLCSMTEHGVVCSGQFGDLLCHKLCNSSSQCPPDMPYCRSIPIAQGDAISMLTMCMREECKTDSDCPQVRCIGMKSICVDGKCKVVDSENRSANCTGSGLNKELCEKYGGHWDECGSACTGQPPGTVCPTVCIAQCECGGLAGWNCPPGYYCMLSGGITDELGVCKKILYQ
jgi:putative hemolysin